MTKVTLRKKMISKGRYTLYLDIYPPIKDQLTGKLERKIYLKIFIYKRARTEADKLHNRETIALAEHIRAQRQIDIQNIKYNYLSEERLNSNFILFFQKEADKRRCSYNWQMAVNYLEAFAGDSFPFGGLTEDFCEKYGNYLLSSPAIGRYRRKISKNTAACYFAKFKSTLRRAYRNNYLLTDLGNIISNIEIKDTHRPFLFLDELQRMVEAECKSILVKKAGLFSALTGVRYSDIESLKWGSIQGTQGNFYILFNQNKTGKAEYLPISDDTFNLLGIRGEDEKKVFNGLKYDLVTRRVVDNAYANHALFVLFRVGSSFNSVVKKKLNG
ncbi:MAG: site-specific integrase [Candidatus Chryseobacterium colombiense]|nr:site-specific integrase [Chryseobacterium sp.]WEK71446.1 MAG: site-specific integrase [Chryseobacterium sp.]